MAIKGKGKTKGRPVVRAPRREPVEVRTPLFARRWVQLLLTFTAGVLAMLFVVWVTNGIRQQRAEELATTEASEQRAAAQTWRGQVEGALGRVGTLSPGVVPVVLPEASSAIKDLREGKGPTDAAGILRQARDDAKTSLDTLRNFDLVGQIRGKGMSKGLAAWFLNSQTRIVQALELYRQAASIALLAVEATGDQRTVLADRAAELEATAAEVLNDGWEDYTNALASVQIFDSPLTGLTGPSGA